MKKTVSIALVLALVLLTLAGCSAAKEPAAPAETAPAAAPADATPAEPAAPQENEVVLKLGHNSNDTSLYNQGCLRFAELVSQYTNGTVTVEVHGNSTLGDEAEMLDGVRMGTINMALINSTELAKYASEFSIMSLPFLFEDYDHISAVVNDAEICGILMNDAETNGGVKLLLPFWADGFRNFVNSKHEVAAPADLNGLKIRCPSYEALIAAVEEFGGTPLTMPFSEAYTGVSSGTCDGMEGTVATILNNGINDICDYLTLDGHVYCPAVLIMNLNDYNDVLSDNQRAAIEQAAKEAGEYQTGLVKASEDEGVAKLIEAGMTVTEVDKSAWADAAVPVYEQFADKYDQALIQMIIALK